MLGKVSRLVSTAWGRVNYLAARGFALVYDGICLFVLLTILRWLVPDRWFGVDLWEFASGGVLQIGNELLVYSVGFPGLLIGLVRLAYVWYSFYAWGATPGMRNENLWFVRRGGGVPSVWRILLRHFLSGLSAVTLVGYLWALVDRQGQTLHDVLSGVLVMHGRDRPGVWTSEGDVRTAPVTRRFDTVDMGVLLAVVSVAHLPGSFWSGSTLRAWGEGSLVLCVVSALLLGFGRRGAGGVSPGWLRWWMFGCCVLVLALRVWGLVFGWRSGYWPEVFGGGSFEEGFV